jgi:aromatic ring-opening dioxygenase catalytic subunit (LigB family)
VRAALPTYFVSHGGGPWPYVPELRALSTHIETSLADIPRQLGSTPKAVLVISGHWETDRFAVTAHPHPPMVYDYSGFPDYTYRVQYSARGSPELARQIAERLGHAGMECELDAQRGFDHGAFTPLAVMYPEATVPVLQLSIQRDYNPAIHMAAGHALQPLREQGVLILGSGLTYHNMRQMGPGGHSASSAFDEWLQAVLVQSPPAQRTQALLDWTQAPAAREAHPREDHLLPLMVAVGAAESEPGTCIYHQDDLFGGVVASSFRFG